MSYIARSGSACAIFRSSSEGIEDRASMRIRNSRNPIDVLPTIKTGPSPAVHAPLSGAFPAERSRPQAAAAPELGVCSVNKSPWDVTPLVLDFFHADGLLHLHQQRCPSGHRDHNEGDCRQASAQEASALEEKHGHFRSESLSPCISSIKLCGNDWRGGGNRRQEWKRSKALCLKSEGSAFGPTTIERSLQNSRRRAVTKGGDGCSPATKGRGTDEVVKSRTCKREDGKGWRCGNEAAPGSTLCEHHLSQVRSYSKRPSNSSSKRHSPSVQEGRRKRRPIVQSTTTTTSADNDCYYYYYTGFGPAWRETKRKSVVAIAEEDGTDDDGGGGGSPGGGTGADAAGGCRANGEGGEDGGKGKIKGRKRVKCRSLKSLL